jgi:hypothetical protein
MPAVISRTALILSPLALLSPAALAAPGQEGAWRIQGGQAHAHLGSSIATADVNGELRDLVVGHGSRRKQSTRDGVPLPRFPTGPPYHA